MRLFGSGASTRAHSGAVVGTVPEGTVPEGLTHDWHIHASPLRTGCRESPRRGLSLTASRTIGTFTRAHYGPVVGTVPEGTVPEGVTHHRYIHGELTADRL